MEEMQNTKVLCAEKELCENYCRSVFGDIMFNDDYSDRYQTITSSIFDLMGSGNVCHSFGRVSNYHEFDILAYSFLAYSQGIDRSHLVVSRLWSCSSFRRESLISAKFNGPGVVTYHFPVLSFMKS